MSKKSKYFVSIENMLARVCARKISKMRLLILLNSYILATPVVRYVFTHGRWQRGEGGESFFRWLLPGNFSADTLVCTGSRHL